MRVGGPINIAHGFFELLICSFDATSRKIRSRVDGVNYFLNFCFKCLLNPVS